jgi:segregation and condensation protein B
MSLKAKIEAVIYASEEPVTLVQLIGLLGEEAQLELDAENAQQQSLALDDESGPGDPKPESTDDAEALNAEVLDASEDGSDQDPVILSKGQSPQSKDPEAAEAGPKAEESSNPDVEAIDAKAAAAAAKLREAEQKLQARKLRDYFRFLLDQLIAEYATGDRGLEIREVAGGFRLATKPEYHDAVRGFVKSLKPPLKLSLQALETLAVVAYKQPVTAPEVSEIRGVESAGTLGSLMARKLIATAGRKQVIGRPILYKTNRDFLVRFGLKDINELPSIEEFEKMAGELNEAVQEEIQMEEHPERETEEHPEDQGTSAPVAEHDSAPDPTHILHDTPEDLMADDSYAPEGHKREHADKHEVEPMHETKSMSETHSAQADGDPGEDA